MAQVSEKFLRFGIEASKKGSFEKPDGFARTRGECGDTVGFYIRVDNNAISGIKYEIDGCINSNACANALIELSEGKSIKNVMALEPSDIIEFLETLPENEHHCADMVIDTIRDAVKDHFQKSSNSWKKQYF